MLRKGINLAIIIIIYFIGNLLSDVLKSVFFIPGSIIGMGLLFLMLSFKVVNFQDMEAATGFFLTNMGFFFVPLGVGVMDFFEVLQPIWIQLSLTLVISCLLVMWVSSKAVDYWICKQKEN